MKPILDPKFNLPSDGWCHAMAIGEFPNSILEPDPAKPGSIRRRRVVQVCDHDASESIVAAFNRAAASPDFTGLLVDRDHESDDPSKTTDAWGWIIALENRDTGLWAQIRWTDLGQPAVAGGRFRFLSPVFDPDQCQDLGNNRIRPLVLIKCGLTNDPNIKPLIPITNRQPAADAAPAPADPGNSTPGNPGRKESSMDFKAQLLALLGLGADATDEQIAAAVAAKKETLANCAATAAERDQLKNRAETAEATLAQHAQAALAAQVEADLDTHKDVIANRDEVKAQLLANREGTLKILLAMRKPAAATPPDALRNRATRTPDGSTLPNRAEEQRNFVNSVRAREKSAGRPCDFNRAWDIARTEKPELFKEDKPAQS